MSLGDRVRSNLREWYARAADRTGEMAKIGVRRYDKFGLSREIERQFAELGSLVYHALGEGRDGVLGDAAVQRLVARIEELAGDLERKDREIEEIRQRQQRLADAAAREAPAGRALPGTAAALGSGDGSGG